MSTVALAECIRLAANIHESSYDHKAAQEGFQGLQPVSFYCKTLQQSCLEAEQAYEAHKGFGQVAYLMLKNSWNEALAWAEDTLTKEAKA